MEISRLLIARHGNTFELGEIPRRVGLTDLPLTEQGREQGRLLGRYLKAKDLIPSIIVTSTLKRTVQTAEELQQTMGLSLTIEQRPIFNEIDYGPDENQPEQHVIARLGAHTLAAWEAHAAVPPGWRVEPARIIQQWQDFATSLTTSFPGQTVLVVTSNGIARFAPYLTGNFKAFSQQHSIKLSTGALGIFEKKQPDTTWTCQQWNIKPDYKAY